MKTGMIAEYVTRALRRVSISRAVPVPGARYYSAPERRAEMDEYYLVGYREAKAKRRGKHQPMQRIPIWRKRWLRDRERIDHMRAGKGAR